MNPGLMCLSGIYLNNKLGAQYPCIGSKQLMAHQLRHHVRLFFAQLGGAPAQLLAAAKSAQVRNSVAGHLCGLRRNNYPARCGAGTWC